MAANDQDLERLKSNIREELAAQSALRDLGLDESSLDGLANSIAVNIEYAFDVKWAPRCVKPGDAHYWSEPSAELPTGENHFAECLLCEWISSHNATRRDAERRYGRHFQNEHSSGA